jgi:phage-related protein
MPEPPREKPLVWVGSTYRDITDEKTFPVAARRQAGHQLSNVQMGLDPDRWKPFDDIGPGAKEIIIDLDDGWYRVSGLSRWLRSSNSL